MNEILTVKFIKQVTSYTRQEKFKQGGSAIVIPLPKKLIVKLFYLESEAWESFHSQLFLYAHDLATRLLCGPRYIKLNNELTGGLSGEYWWYVCEQAEPIYGMNTNRVLLAMKNKLKRITSTVFDLYTVDNVGIYDGKLVLVDCLP